MPKFVSVHRAPGLTREAFAGNARAVFTGKKATYLQSYVHLGDGFLVTVFEAASQGDLEEQFEILGFPHDEIHEIQFALSRAEMEGMLAGEGGSKAP